MFISLAWKAERYMQHVIKQYNQMSLNHQVALWKQHWDFLLKLSFWKVYGNREASLVIYKTLPSLENYSNDTSDRNISEPYDYSAMKGESDLKKVCGKKKTPPSSDLKTKPLPH